MDRFFLTIDANASFGGDAPTLEILVGGVVVSSAVLSKGSSTYMFELEFSGADYPSSLSFRFQSDSSGETQRSITFESVKINGQDIVGTTNISTLLLSVGNTSTISTADTAYLFGRQDPTQGDLGTETVSGTTGDDARLDGGNGADVINGDAGNDRIRGLGNDDAINGGDGNDTIFAEAGNDIVIGGAGNDMIFGGTGDDLLYGQDGKDYLIGEDGDDVLNGGLGDDVLVGDAGSDILFGEDGNDWLIGDDDNDYLFGDAGDDNIIGGDGDDIMLGGDDDDQMHGEAGDDIIYGEAGVDLITGGAGADTLYGGDGNDHLIGDAGNDILIGEEGNDTLDGGADTDTASYALATSGVTVNLSDTTQQNTIGAGRDTLSNIENLTGSAYDDILTGTGGVNEIIGGAGDDTITGDAGGDTLRGGDGADTIYGDGGADVIFGDAGADILYGGAAGDDFYISGTDSLGDQYDGGTGVDEIRLQGDSYFNLANSFTSIETIQTAGYVIYADTGTGFDLSGMSIVGGSDLRGQGGDETITGSDSADTISGGAGADTLSGGTGNDTINGDAGADILSGGTGTDTINGGDDGDTIHGGDDADILNGDAGADTIYGEAGADTIHGGTEADTIYGGTEDDILYGDAGADSLYGDAGTDTLYGGDDGDTIYGGDGDDTLYGEGGADTLYGNLGSDTIDGGDGDDTLYATAAAAVTLLDVSFDSSVNGFTYSDGGFGGTDPANADVNGSYDTTDGNTANGSLEVAIDGLDSTSSTNISGSWDYALSAGGSDLTNVQISFSFRHWMSSQTDNGDDTYVYLDFDGTYYDQSGGNSYVSLLEGHGGTGADDDTGWITVTIDLPDLTAGNVYNLSLGIFQTSENNATETSYVKIDDVTITGIAYGDNDLDTVNTLNGGAGNDTLHGSGGADILNGGDGNDTLYSGSQTVAGDSVTLLDVSFDSDEDGLTYSDGGFGGTDPLHADATGSYITTDGNTSSGALEVYIDGLDNTASTNISGSWDETITVGGTRDLTNVQIQFSYRHWMSGDTDNGDNSEVYFEFDGTIYDQNGGNSYINQLLGANGNGADDDTGWVTVTITLPDLTAGATYDFSIGILQTAENRNTEVSWLHIDDILFTADELVVNDANTLNGQDGQDDLYGSGGSDIFLFESASAFNDIDTINNFKTGQNDAIDISDLLSGYDPLTDLITDFVEITDSGSDSILKVDTTGSGSFGAGTQIATIIGVTGLTDELALETAGNLITV